MLHELRLRHVATVTLLLVATGSQTHAQLNAAPPDQSTGTSEPHPPPPKWVNIDQVTFAHPTSLTDSQQAHLVRGLEEYLVPNSAQWLQNLEAYFIADDWKDRGYFFVKVRATARVLKTDADGEHVALDIDVNEGPQFRTGTIAFARSDGTAPLSIPSPELQKAVTVHEGELLSQGKLKDSSHFIADVYASRGYPTATVTPVLHIDAQAKKIDITFSVSEGQKSGASPSVTG